MTIETAELAAPRPSHVRNPRSLFIGGAWVEPSSSSTFDIIDSATEEVFLTVAEAQAPDIELAVAAARMAFDRGPWPRLSPAERGVWLGKIADAWEKRGEALADTWALESGVLRSMGVHSAKGVADVFRYYAGLGGTFAWQEKHTSSMGLPALLVREPVDVVAAIIPWNAPHSLMAYKVAAVLIAGCTVIIKASPEAPASPYFMAEICEEVGLPAGVVNVLTSEREEIFGLVLSVIPAESEEQAIEIANDTIYGLNSSVFTNDPDRAYAVGRQLRAGTVGHNGFKNDFGIAFGGFKQSGIGREGGIEGLHPNLEAKTMVFETAPTEPR